MTLIRLDELSIEALRGIFVDLFRAVFFDDPKVESEFEDFERKIWDDRNLLIKEIERLKKRIRSAS